MAARKFSKALTFLTCAVPWAFLLAWCDHGASVSFWPVFLAVLVLLGCTSWYCGKKRQISLALAGNALSCFLSVLLTIPCFEVTNYYFSPFRPVDFMIFLSALLLSLQVTLWRIQRKAPAPSLMLQFAETMAILFAAAVAFVFALLAVSAWVV